MTQKETTIANAAPATSDIVDTSSLSVLAPEYEWIKQHALTVAHAFVMDIHKLKGGSLYFEAEAEAEKVLAVAKKFEAYLREKL